MKKETISFFLILVSMCTINSGCALKSIETVELGEMMNPESRVLIATQSTEFKEAVVSRITDALDGGSSYLKIIDVAKLGEESADAYDAIVILNTCMAYRMNESVTTFLEKVEGKERIVLLTTVADGRDEYQPEGVDAITSASRMNDGDEIATQIIDKVQAVLDSGG